MSADAGCKCRWGSRRTFVLAMVSQVVGINNFIFLPHRAVNKGAAGHVLAYTFLYITLGIPILYMEYVVGQFTERDCLAVWRARPLLSHVGYIHILWQLVFLVYCHTVNSVVMHYFLISFEDPIPYYICGPWSNRDCNILKTNYTVNQDCIRAREPHSYCTNLYVTYPEYQYWRFYLLGLNKQTFYVAWRVGLASLLITIVVYISCFKRIKSIKLVLGFFIIFPSLSYVVFAMGSMVQKGIVVKYEDALDTDFSKFFFDFDFSGMASEVIFALNLGTGISFTLASTSSFRSPCYSNTVIATVISCATTTVGVCATALMVCPYAFEYNVKPGAVLIDNISFTFEKAPRLLHAYHSTAFWLILTFSIVVLCALRTNILLVSCLLEMLAVRYPCAAKYPGLVTFAMTATLYISTIPLLSNATFNFVMDFKRVFSIVKVLMVIIEIVVFVLWYGVERFAEDIHFMQGSQPRVWMKVGWVVSTFVLSYVFVIEVYYLYSGMLNTSGTIAGWWMLVINITWIVLVSAVKLVIGMCRNKYKDLVRLDRSWGPKSEVLQRSRAMFSAQAMTKEYLYRQYHLQAGIVSRQMRSNMRNPDFGSTRMST